MMRGIGIIAVTPRTEGVMQMYDIVGPVCETGDFLGKIRHLRIEEGDLLAVSTVGAYGSVMSSKLQYSSTSSRSFG